LVTNQLWRTIDFHSIHFFLKHDVLSQYDDPVDDMAKRQAVTWERESQFIFYKDQHTALLLWKQGQVR